MYEKYNKSPQTTQQTHKKILGMNYRNWTNFHTWAIHNTHGKHNWKYIGLGIILDCVVGISMVVALTSTDPLLNLYLTSELA